jgi:putative MATE family efflux protein
MTGEVAPPPNAAPVGISGTGAPLWRTFFVFLVPMMLSNVLQALSGTLNSVFLGQMIGVGAIAAASIFFPLMFFFVSFVMGLSMGSTVLIGQAFGARNMDRVRNVAAATASLAMAGGLVIAVLGGLFARPLMMALGTPPDILDQAVSYARIMLIAMPAFFLFILWTSILRGIGDSVTPLWTLVLSTIIGLVLTPALIQGWGGLPKLGVAAAAVASIVAMIVSMVWLGWRLRQRKDPLAPDIDLIRRIRFDWGILKTVLRLGIPTAVQMVMMALAEIVLLGFVNRFGSDATAAYGATNQVLSYVQFPAMSIGITASILGAQAIGAGRSHQLDDIVKTGLGMNLALTGFGVLIVYLFSESVVRMFITDPAVVDLTQPLLHIVVWSVLLMGVSVVFSGMMRASGTVWPPVLLNLCAIAAVEVPVAWVLSNQIGIEGIWWAYPAVFGTMASLQVSYYLLVWRKRPIKALA